ncbi:MAG: hypothetical protein V4472_04135 [Pseudomonadota bacterium]
MSDGKPQFILLKAINGEPLLVNLCAVRTMATIDLAGNDVGVVSFDKDHDVVIGSNVSDFIAAMAAPALPGPA